MASGWREATLVGERMRPRGYRSADSPGNSWDTFGRSSLLFKGVGMSR